MTCIGRTVPLLAMEMRTVKARFSSQPRSGTCFDPVSAQLILSPGANKTWVWSEFTSRSSGMSSSLITNALRRKDCSHCSSQLFGFFCAACVPFRGDQCNTSCNHFCMKDSEARNIEPSQNVFSKISGADLRIIATMIPRALTTVTWAPLDLIAIRQSLTAFTILG